MKTTSLLATSLLVALVSIGTSGCAIFQQSSAPDATKPVGGKAINLLQFRNDVQATRAAVASTSDALGRIPGSPNPQAAYAAYSTELNALTVIATKTSEESAAVRTSGKELFAEWQLQTQSIKNPDIRAIAEGRRAKLYAAYDEMLTPLIEARANLTPLINNLTDLRKALALDLTPAGIEATKPLITKAKDESATTISSLDALSAKLDNIAAVLPPPTVAPVK